MLIDHNRVFVCVYVSVTPFDRLVPDLSEDDYPSSKSDSSDQEDEQLARHPLHSLSSASPSHHRHQQQQKQQQHVHADLASTPSTTSASSSASATAISSPAAHAPSATAPVSKSSDEDDDIGDGLRTAIGVIGLGSGTAIVSHAVHLDRSAGSMATVGIAGGGGHQVERRRRKLPEIPKNRKCKFGLSVIFFVAYKLGINTILYVDNRNVYFVH